MGLSGGNLERLGATLSQLAKAAACRSASLPPYQVAVEAAREEKDEKKTDLTLTPQMPNVDLARGVGGVSGRSSDLGPEASGGRLDVWA